MIISKNITFQLLQIVNQSSQIGDISKFKNINLLAATEREVRLSLNSKTKFEIIANKIDNRTKCQEFYF